MSMRAVIGTGLTLLALSLVGLGAWIFRLPVPPPVPAAVKAVPPGETDAMRAALKPPKRERPLVAVVGINDATETTDYLLPTGILRRADVADVRLLSTGPGPVRLYPALTVLADATIADFDARYREGADYVIVPAMRRDDDPAVLAWLRDQARKGAIVVGVCAGAKVVAAAGLLDGKQATTHWYYRKEMLEAHPSIRYVADRRMVAGQGVATTTGISASMPMMLTLIEVIGGPQKAAEVARGMGMTQWDARHDSDSFKLTRPFALTVLGNVAALWRHEQFGIELSAGLDEVSLALVADAWSRTYRSKVRTFAASTAAVESRHGIRILPDDLAIRWHQKKQVARFFDRKPVDALDGALDDIGMRYGPRTADVVAMQLEYPGTR